VEELLELLELFEVLDLLVLLDLLDLLVLPELLDLLVLPEPFDDLAEEFDVPELPVDDELLLADVPESLTVACVAPGRTTSTAPATATLAKDAVTVVAVSRRLPCSRSATARASCRALA